MSRTKNSAKPLSSKSKKPISRPGERSLTAGTRRIALLAAMLAIGTLAIYIPVLRCPFVVMDDREYVTGNLHVQEGLTWSTVKWAFTSTETAAYWHPLTWLSHALDCQVFGLNPIGHHFDNVLIHALNAALLFLLFVWMTKRLGASLLVAALFAVHPLNVESVAWVAERKNVLCTLFFILAIAAYVHYVRKPHWQRYLAVVGLFAAGLMAKPMVTTLPFVLLLLDYWPLERTPLNSGERSGGETGGAHVIPPASWKRLVLEKLPLLVLSAASSQITLIAQGRVELTLAELPLKARIGNGLVAYGLYLWKTLWPARLAAFYPFPLSRPVWQIFCAVLVLVAVTAMVIIFHRKSYLPVGWFWFLGTLVPAIGLVQVWKQAMADRFAYIPSIGIFVMIAWCLDDWADARKIRTAWRIGPALCVLAVLAVISIRQMSYWESQYDVWSRSLAVEESMAAHNFVGEALISPDDAMSKHDLMMFDTEHKRQDEARRHFERVLEMGRQQRPLDRPSMAEMVVALNTLAFIDGAQRLPNEVQRRHYEQAWRLERQLQVEDFPGRYRKNLVNTLISLANLDMTDKRIDEARPLYAEAVKIDRQLLAQHLQPYLPYMAMAEINLGHIDGHEGRLDDARRDYEDGLNTFRELSQQDPNTYLLNEAQALASIAVLDKKQNRVEDARVHFTEALNIYRIFAQGDPTRYANDVARIEVALQGLGNNSASQ